jgi:hypothetical protein
MTLIFAHPGRTDAGFTMGDRQPGKCRFTNFGRDPDHRQVFCSLGIVSSGKRSRKTGAHFDKVGNGKASVILEKVARAAGSVE